MKKLITLILCLYAGVAFGQVNGSIQRTDATNTVRYYNATGPKIDSLVVSNGVGVDGYVPLYKSALKKSVWVNPSTFSPSLSVSTVSPGGYANGLNYAAGVFRLGKVSATNPGVLTTGTDTIAGSKIFNSTVSSGGGFIATGGSNTFTSSTFNGGITVTGGAFTSNVASSLGNGNAVSITGTPGIFRIYNNLSYSQLLGQATANRIVKIQNKSYTLADSADVAGVTSSLTNGAVYSLSGALTNTAPTSGTIGYWSRSGTALSPATSGDVVTISTSGARGLDITSTSNTNTALVVSQSGTSNGISSNTTSGTGLSSISTTGTALDVRNNDTTNPAAFIRNSGSGDIAQFINASGQQASISNTGVVTGNQGLFTDGSQGLVIRPYTAGGGYGAIYPVGVTPGGSNYTLIAKSDAAILNSSTSVTLAVGDAGKLTASSTGGSVSGNWTATTQSSNDNSTKLATTAYVDGRTPSGTYTPTLVASTNVTSVGSASAHYTRVGNEVTVQGYAQATPTTAGGTNSVFTISLPIASNMTNTYNLIGNGTVIYGSGSASSMYVLGDTSLDVAQVNFPAQSNTGNIFYYSFTYTVL